MTNQSPSTQFGVSCLGPNISRSDNKPGNVKEQHFELQWEEAVLRLTGTAGFVESFQIPFAIPKPDTMTQLLP
ncbi:unnamed protein product [Rodentolepis nana]|uniref:Uncharacterized protein n=1 Tax=Rodentolepis nana TaxID=102285 RepID=A0A0R3TGX3_RODNA|nr:unnamed protein product [Rodentolepis nana]